MLDPRVSFINSKLYVSSVVEVEKYNAFPAAEFFRIDEAMLMSNEAYNGKYYGTTFPVKAAFTPSLMSKISTEPFDMKTISKIDFETLYRYFPLKSKTFLQCVVNLMRFVNFEFLWNSKYFESSMYVDFGLTPNPTGAHYNFTSIGNYYQTISYDPLLTSGLVNNYKNKFGSYAEVLTAAFVESFMLPIDHSNNSIVVAPGTDYYVMNNNYVLGISVKPASEITSIKYGNMVDLLTQISSEGLSVFFQQKFSDAATLHLIDGMVLPSPDFL